MKQFLVLLFFVSTAFAQGLFIGAEDETKECLEELSIKSERVRNLENLEEITEMTKEEKCVLRCIMKKTGAIDERGNLIPDELNDDATDELNPDLDFSKCTPQRTITDLCEQNFVLTQCIFDVIAEAAVKEN